MTSAREERRSARDPEGPGHGDDAVFPPPATNATAPLVVVDVVPPSPAPATGGDGAEDAPEGLGTVLTALRWATTTIAILLLSTGESGNRDAVVGAAVLSYALWRTVRPLGFAGGLRRALPGVLGEAAVMVTAIATTGYWESPFAFGVVTVISAAGFAGGNAAALQTAAGCLLAVGVPYHLLDRGARVEVTVQWAGELLLIAILAGYVRRLSMQGRAETSLYLGRLRQLSEVNDLLLQLHRVAHTVPMSLDMSETVESSCARLRELFQPDVVVILLREDEQWCVVTSSGAALPPQLDGNLPDPLQAAASGATAVAVRSLDGAGNTGLAPGSRSGIYAPLTARDEVIGVVGVERRDGEPFNDQQGAVMAAFAQQMAIAVDNARWFSRIGTLAAEQERSRIARDLHDRVGQSLALVGFELDRVARSNSDHPVSRQLVELRDNVRSVVTELRETLHDLRTDVSEEQDLVVALEDFLERVRRRSGLTVQFEHQASRRMALTVEREVWRIAQEAVFNAERHAHATSLRIVWTTDEDVAELWVIDDGCGISPEGAFRPGGYGVVGMQERARAIGGSLSISSSPGAGTTVHLTIAR
ncbi:MAG: GAF domain-containing protein [Actinomycetota bacterium]|nr:GAF domain-containing protein [Actinomycetota bacterium]